MFHSLLTMRLIRTALISATLVIVLLVGGPPRTAHAATFTVPAGDEEALLAAIIAANDEVAHPGPDVINLAAGSLYSLYGIHNMTDGPNGLPSITSDITINGNGATIRRTLLTGFPELRIFHVAASGSLTLNKITVAKGLVSSSDPGGGILSRGTLTLTNSTLSDNSAGSGGGIFNWDGTLTLTSSTLSGNLATGAGFYGIGGGIANQGGTVTVTNSTLLGNSATGGNIFFGLDTGGGGIFNGGTLTLTNSILSGNTAVTDGGGIFNFSSALTLINSTLSGNTAVSDGGGIYNNSGTLTLTNSTLSGNTAAGDYGGGIYNDPSGTAFLTSSTLSGNSTGFRGGGMYNDSGTLTLTNSTLSGNSAVSDNLFVFNDGGGIYNTGTLTVYNSTLSGNTADIGAGGIYNDPSGTTFLINTIVANSPGGGNCFGTITNGGNNLQSSDDSCGFGSFADPLLGPLAKNGGPTQTHALLPGSPAIDAANNTFCQGTGVGNVDQRGLARGGDGDGTPDSPQPGDCDIGAFEYQFNLLDNPGFETALNATLDWRRARGETTDRRLCNNTTYPANAGLCAFLFNGDSTLDRLQQVVPRPGGLANDAYRVSAYIRGYGLIGVNRIRIAVRQADGGSEVFSFDLPGNTYGYQLVTFSFSPVENYTQIIVLIEKQGGGKLLVDEVVLVQTGP